MATLALVTNFTKRTKIRDGDWLRYCEFRKNYAFSPFSENSKLEYQNNYEILSSYNVQNFTFKFQ